MGPHWASRGGLKLAGALQAFGVAVEGRRCLDVGASTGGFTDVLLAGGAAVGGRGRRRATGNSSGGCAPTPG